MPQYKSIRTLSLAALMLGAGLVAHAQESGEAEEIPVEADDSTLAGGKTCYVSKVRFENEGAYQVDMFKVNGYQFRGFLSQTQSRTWSLDQANMELGEEFFLRYRLDQGDSFKSKNCKKNGTTLRYHPDGNTWSHWSKGSTKINNRCRYRNNKCITSVD